MKDQLTYQGIELIEVIREKYFPEENFVTLAEGETLLKEGQTNEKLFLVEEGSVCGCIFKGKEPIELFHCSKNMFVGVYSFFSNQSISYSTVVAKEPTKLLYITRAQLRDMELDLVEFNEHFLPIVVNELHNRQEDAQKFYDQKQEALKGLLVQEKLAALGQLSAGLAHELNNAVAVLSQKVQAFTDKLASTLSTHGVKYTQLMIHASTGQDRRSSSDLRKIRKAIEDKVKGIKPGDVRKIACIITAEQLKSASDIKQLQQGIEELYEAWSIGKDLYDMRVASDHAAHIVASVKTLAAPKKSTSEILVKDTLYKALALLQNQVKKVNLETSIEDDFTTVANEGDLVQIWMNIIKNAVEALEIGEVSNPQISLNMRKEGAKISVEIMDNGPGIPKDKLREVFQPSFTTKQEGSFIGLGLGLSIVERLVHSYQGTINVDSIPGKTVFEITLPLNHG